MARNVAAAVVVYAVAAFPLSAQTASDHGVAPWTEAVVSVADLDKSTSWLVKHGGWRTVAAGELRTYVHCTDPLLVQAQFPYVAKLAKADPAWNYHELQTGHDAMITDPQGVAQTLIAAMMAGGSTGVSK